MSVSAFLDFLVTTGGLEPPYLAAPPPQDGVSTSFTTWPCFEMECKNKARLRDCQTG